MACISFSNITYDPFFFFQGTTADQDNRFSDKKKKLMKSMKFNDGLEKKVCLTDPKKKISRDNYKLFKKDRIKIFIFFIQ